MTTDSECYEFKKWKQKYSRVCELDSKTVSLTDHARMKRLQKFYGKIWKFWLKEQIDDFSVLPVQYAIDQLDFEIRKYGVSTKTFRKHGVKRISTRQAIPLIHLFVRCQCETTVLDSAKIFFQPQGEYQTLISNIQRDREPDPDGEYTSTFWTFNFPKLMENEWIGKQKQGLWRSLLSEKNQSVIKVFTKSQTRFIREIESEMSTVSCFDYEDFNYKFCDIDPLHIHPAKNI